MIEKKELKEEYEREYNLLKDRSFLGLISYIKKKGYSKDIKDMSDYYSLMNTIYSRYRILPDDNNNYFQDLLDSLPKEYRRILDCYYKGEGYITLPSNNKKTVLIHIAQKTDSNIHIPGPCINIFADIVTGVIYDFNEYETFYNERETIFKEDFIPCGMNLKELYHILSEKYNEELDLSSLRQSLIDKEYSQLIRDSILKRISLKLLYSEEDPQKGYYRACKFNKDYMDFYQKRGDTISLSIKKMLDILNKYHEEDSKARNLTKK